MKLIFKVIPPITQSQAINENTVGKMTRRRLN